MEDKLKSGDLEKAGIREKGRKRPRKEEPHKGSEEKSKKHKRNNEVNRIGRKKEEEIKTKDDEE